MEEKMEINDKIYGGIDPLAWLAANQTADLRRDTGKSEADIKSALGEGFCGVEKSIGDTRYDIAKSESGIKGEMGRYAGDHFRHRADIAERHLIHLNGVERDLQNRIHETRYSHTKELGDKTERILDIMSRDFTDVKNQLRETELNSFKQFAHLEAEGIKNTAKVLETLAKDKYDVLRDELFLSRQERQGDRLNYQSALASQDLASIKNMINSVDQNQKFSSKTVQFGTGNVALPTQTANQA